MSDPLNILTVKIGTKYLSQHVNELYEQCLMHVEEPFTFFCYTEDSSGLHPNIVPIQYQDYNLDPVVYNKLRLFDQQMPFKGRCLYFDIDVVLQKSVSPLLVLPQPGKLRTIKTYWRPIEPVSRKFATDDFRLYYFHHQQHNINSSIMIWHTDSAPSLWNSLLDNIEPTLTEFFLGMDSYLYFKHQDKLEYFEVDMVGSYLYGTDFNYETRKVIRNTGRVPVLLLNGVDDIDTVKRELLQGV